MASACHADDEGAARRARGVGCARARGADLRGASSRLCGLSVFTTAETVRDSRQGTERAGVRRTRRSEHQPVKTRQSGSLARRRRARHFSLSARTSAPRSPVSPGGLCCCAWDGEQKSAETPLPAACWHARSVASPRAYCTNGVGKTLMLSAAACRARQLRGAHSEPRPVPELGPSPVLPAQGRRARTTSSRRMSGASRR